MIIRIASGKRTQIQEVKVKEEGKTLLSLMQEHNIYMDAPCNGRGSCGRCRVLFFDTGADGKAYDVPMPTEKEKKTLSEREIRGGIRLACCTVPMKDCFFEILETEEERIVVLTEENTDACGERRRKEANGEHRGDDTCRRKALRRKAACGGLYGIAVDVGTTTLAMELVNLESGKVEGVNTSINHQRMFGADVISRIQASNEGKGTLLQESICADLNRMLNELLEKAEKPECAVKKVVLVGNTTMCHLLLGYSCRTLGEAPFRPVDISLQQIDPGMLLKRSKLEAGGWILPGISAFAGSDLVSCIYGCGMDGKKETAMLLDIGTNGEMAIGNRDGFLVTSAAAGPVFEGGGISCGVPGIPGAIAHISFDNTSGERGQERFSPAADSDGTQAGLQFLQGIRLETVEGKAPVGLCGTGIIDITAELLEQGMLDENGTLTSPWFDSGVPITDGLTFLQEDIREVQMGKSAIRSGIETLLSQYQGAYPDTVYLSGGFGYYMNAAAAERIGLFPHGFHKKIVLLGNGALEGARHFLLDADGSERVKNIAASAEEINLANQKQFQELYLEHMFFDTKNSY